MSLICAQAYKTNKHDAILEDLQMQRHKHMRSYLNMVSKALDGLDRHDAILEELQMQT